MEKSRLWSQTTCFNKFLNLWVPQFSQVENEANDNILLHRLLELNERML